MKNANDYNLDAAVSTMSGNFLTEELPSNWQDMEKNDLNEFILDHVSSPYENWEIDDIWTLIEQVGGAAFSMHKKAQKTKETFDAIDAIEENAKWATEAKYGIPQKISISLDEDTLPLTEVTARLRDILGVDGETYGLEIALRDYHRECLIILGTCALDRHILENEGDP